MRNRRLDVSVCAPARPKIRRRARHRLLRSILFFFHFVIASPRHADLDTDINTDTPPAHSVRRHLAQRDVTLSLLRHTAPAQTSHYVLTTTRRVCLPARLRSAWGMGRRQASLGSDGSYGSGICCGPPSRSVVDDEDAGERAWTPCGDGCDEMLECEECECECGCWLDRG